MERGECRVIFSIEEAWMRRIKQVDRHVYELYGLTQEEIIEKRK